MENHSGDTWGYEQRHKTLQLTCQRGLYGRQLLKVNELMAGGGFCCHGSWNAWLNSGASELSHEQSVNCAFATRTERISWLKKVLPELPFGVFIFCQCYEENWKREDKFSYKLTGEHSTGYEYVNFAGKHITIMCSVINWGNFELIQSRTLEKVHVYWERHSVMDLNLFISAFHFWNKDKSFCWLDRKSMEWECQRDWLYPLGEAAIKTNCSLCGSGLFYCSWNRIDVHFLLFFLEW